MENDGKRTVHTRNVGMILPKIFKSEEAQKERQARIQGQ